MPKFFCVQSSFIPLLKSHPISNVFYTIPANQDKVKAVHFRRYYTQPYVALIMLARNKIVVQSSLVVYTMENLTLYTTCSLFTHTALRERT